MCPRTANKNIGCGVAPKSVGTCSYEMTCSHTLFHLFHTSSCGPGAVALESLSNSGNGLEQNVAMCSDSK